VTLVQTSFGTSKGQAVGGRGGGEFRRRGTDFSEIEEGDDLRALDAAGILFDLASTALNGHGHRAPGDAIPPALEGHLAAPDVGPAEQHGLVVRATQRQIGAGHHAGQVVLDSQC